MRHKVWNVVLSLLSLVLTTSTTLSQSNHAGAADHTFSIPPRPLHYQKSVTKLMDKTFEHQTQASTGQTTGSWLIWFHVRGDETRIHGDMPEDDFWQSHNIVLGSVNADLMADETMERFSLGKDELPLFLFLHRGKLYRYPSPSPSSQFQWKDLTEFVLGGYRLVKEEKVPPPMSEFTRIMRQLAGPVGMPLRIGLVLIVVIFILYTSLISYFTGHSVKSKLA